MRLNIACIEGDGIGPEIVTEAKKILDKVASGYGHKSLKASLIPEQIKV